MKKTKGEFIEDLSVLGRIDVKGAKFNYRLAKIKRELEKVKKAVEATKKELPQEKEFREAQLEVYKKYGKRKFQNGQEFFSLETFDPNVIDAFNAGIKEAEEKFPDYTNALKEQQKEQEDLLKEEETLEMFLIPEDMVPDDVTTKQMDVLLDYIDMKG